MKPAPQTLTLLFAIGCAATESGSASQRAASSGTSIDDRPVPPPPGSKRLSSSIICEPEPPCPDCVTETGEKARRIGSLDKEVIRGVIRGHLGEVKACYDTVWTTHPDAQGRMMVRLGIAPSGSVETSCLVSSSLNDSSVELCVVDDLLRWTFPRPDGGGWVIVSYPFVFTR